MNKKYAVVLIMLFLLGLGARQLFDSAGSSDKQGKETPAVLDLQTVQFKGKGDQPISPFDINDPRIRILYFGFAKCPDVCPTSLAVLAGTFNQLDKQTLDQFRPVFISLDPERDLPDNVQQFAQYFHPSIEGAVTSLQEIKALADYYGVFYRKVKLENSRLDYTIDHTSYFYFTQPDGALIRKVPHTLTPKPILDAINAIINPTQQPDEETK